MIGDFFLEVMKVFHCPNDSEVLVLSPQLKCKLAEGRSHMLDAVSSIQGDW